MSIDTSYFVGMTHRQRNVWGRGREGSCGEGEAKGFQMMLIIYLISVKPTSENFQKRHKDFLEDYASEHSRLL